MKCAMELNVIAAARQMEVARMRQATIDEATAASVVFCETVIDEDLTKQASEGRSYIGADYQFHAEKTVTGVDVLYPIKPDGYKYANGDISYDVNRDICYLKEAFTEYLSEHCLKVTWRQGSYRSYGNGTRTAVVLDVCVPCGG